CRRDEGHSGSNRSRRSRAVPDLSDQASRRRKAITANSLILNQAHYETAIVSLPASYLFRDYPLPTHMGPCILFVRERSPRGCGCAKETSGAMRHRVELIQHSIPFLREVKDMTPGAEMEQWLNEKYGPESNLYRDLARLIKLGLQEGWAANQNVDGPNYRRSR